MNSGEILLGIAYGLLGFSFIILALRVIVYFTSGFIANLEEIKYEKKNER